MSAPVNVGDVLAGKYLVERVLGAGGMGVVVAAKHLQLDERVAIKFLLPDALKQAGLVARFLREGRLAAKIRSDHAARVRDVGTLESGAPYLVLEYLDGIDLNELIKQRGPLRVETAIEYILQACEALAEAHSLGIVHRDLKPANLFLTSRPDGSACVKLIDFGISKLAGGEGELDLTKTAEMRGSPLFMSPEQVMASPNVGARSDLWALGVTLHNLLTGTHPFPATMMPELIGKILQGTPVPLRAARPDAPEGVEASILRCLRKSPEERYSNVAELAASLAPFTPPHARISIDRISRILHTPVLPGGAPADTGAPPRIPEGTGGAQPSATGAASWSRTGTGSSVGRRSIIVFALGALVILGLGGAALLLRRASVEPTLASDKPAEPLEHEARSPTGPSVIPAAPAVSPSAISSESSTALAPAASAAGSSVATSVPSATPVARSSAAPVRAPASAALPAVKPKPKPGGDLFNTSL